MTSRFGFVRSNLPRALGWGLASLLLAAAAGAQSDHHHPQAGHHSIYAGQEASGISSLSRQEHDDLLQGAGMGMARPAELNHYPGPKHVLELAEELELSDEQRTAVDAIRSAMLDRARALGEQIVQEERHLDRRFALGHIDEETLREATARTAALYGALRFTHLRAHLETRAVLSEEQVDRYDRLRGYTSP